MVQAGQIVKVTVLEVDEKRKRIALTMRLTDAAGPRDTRVQGKPAGGKPSRAPAAPMDGAMAAAFSKLKG